MNGPPWDRRTSVGQTDLRGTDGPPWDRRTSLGQTALPGTDGPPWDRRPSLGQTALPGTDGPPWDRRPSLGQTDLPGTDGPPWDRLTPKCPLSPTTQSPSLGLPQPPPPLSSPPTTTQRPSLGLPQPPPPLSSPPTTTQSPSLGLPQPPPPLSSPPTTTQSPSLGPTTCPSPPPPPPLQPPITTQSPSPAPSHHPEPQGLDPILYKKCQGDAARLCHTHGWNETNELMPPGAVFSCLYRHAYRTEEQGRRLSRDCKVEVQRILHQRALDVKLDPDLQKRCLTDLGKWCSDKTGTGQELECLQDHLEDLLSGCGEVVGNLTELQSEVPLTFILIQPCLIRACQPVIQSHCHLSSDVSDNQVDTGDVMECLVQNKHQKEMNSKCTVGVTHFQLIQMKDFRFSYKFKMACKEDVLKLCPNIKKKVDVVICLSTTVRNDTLQDVKEQRVSLKCRKQLRVEELEMSEDIRLEPELYDVCKTDIGRLCSNVVFGNAQTMECLKDRKKQLSRQCHQRVFKLQEGEMLDPELDYQLMRVCKQMTKRFCTDVDAKNMLQCLKQNKNSELMDPKCKQMITKRQITQNTDYRLNPILRKACKADIPKFCQPILNKASDDSELEGQVIGCLKLKYADQRLSPDCEDQIRVIMQESALDYRLDPQLQIHCVEEIPGLCAEEAVAQEQTGQVEECLKANLLKIKHDLCKKEVLNMLKESKADVFVDPVLHTACALDLKHQCAAVTPGRGRQMACLLESLQDKKVRLQPECKKRLQDRMDMWSYAAKVAPAEGFSDLAMQVMISPSKNYILFIISLGVIVLFLVGLLCGRITKRVTRELKDR
uniref:Golgi apparatus protein 1-like n=2 Tax=Oncorhynchus gorbuscha TaxID=8017 RepID=UPI001EAEC8E3|nr:Golgi apparatus protein 1-like [Oncorhynchus gorbuscha]